jgi:hypothetical protein
MLKKYNQFLTAILQGKNDFGKRTRYRNFQQKNYSLDPDPDPTGKLDAEPCGTNEMCT